MLDVWLSLPSNLRSSCSTKRLLSIPRSHCFCICVAVLAVLSTCLTLKPPFEHAVILILFWVPLWASNIQSSIHPCNHSYIYIVIEPQVFYYQATFLFAQVVMAEFSYLFGRRQRLHVLNICKPDDFPWLNVHRDDHTVFFQEESNGRHRNKEREQAKGLSRNGLINWNAYSRISGSKRNSNE